MDHPTSGLKEIIASSFTARPALTAALSGTIVLFPLSQHPSAAGTAESH